MTTNRNNKPIDSVRDGAIKASIWKNEGEKGSFYSVRVTRTWRDQDGAYHDSESFAERDLLRLAHVAHRAYDRVAELRAADRKASRGRDR